MKQKVWQAFIVVLMGGFLGELTFMVAGVLIGSLVGRSIDSGNFADLGLAILGALTGCAVSSGIGTYLTQRRIFGKGRLGFGVFGGILGIAIIMLLAEPLRVNQISWLMWGLILVLPPTLATLIGWQRP